MSETDVLQTVGALILIVLICSGITYIIVKIAKFAWTGDW